MQLLSDQTFVFLKTVFESDGFIPSAYGRSTAPMLEAAGLLQIHLLDEPKHKHVVYERDRNIGKCRTDKSRTYSHVLRGWRLTREAERSVLTMAMHFNHRTIFPYHVSHKYMLPSISNLKDVKYSMIIATEIPDDSMVQWCIDADIGVIHQTSIYGIHQTSIYGGWRERLGFRCYVEEDRAVEFKLRFG